MTVTCRSNESVGTDQAQPSAYEATSVWVLSQPGHSRARQTPESAIVRCGDVTRRKLVTRDHARASGTVEDECRLDAIDRAIRLDDDRGRAIGIASGRVRVLDATNKALPNLRAGRGRQIAQQSVESRAVHLVACDTGRERLDARIVRAPPDGVAAPRMKPRVLDGRQHPERGEHLVGARRNRLGEGAPLAARPLDDQDAVTPRREQAPNCAAGGACAEDDDSIE